MNPDSYVLPFMPELELPFGRGSLALNYDDQRFHVLSANGLESQRPLSDAEIGAGDNWLEAH